MFLQFWLSYVNEIIHKVLHYLKKIFAYSLFIFLFLAFSLFRFLALFVSTEGAVPASPLGNCCVVLPRPFMFLYLYRNRFVIVHTPSAFRLEPTVFFFLGIPWNYTCKILFCSGLTSHFLESVLYVNFSEEYWYIILQCNFYACGDSREYIYQFLNHFLFHCITCRLFF